MVDSLCNFALSCAVICRLKPGLKFLLFSAALSSVAEIYGREPLQLRSLLCCDLWLVALVIAAALLYCAVICGRYLWQRVSVALFPAVLSTVA